MKLTKRLLSILLVVCMVCSMLPAVLLTASAAPGDWVLVTDASSLKVGDKVVIVAKSYNVAMSTTQNSHNRPETAIKKSGNTVTIDSSVQQFTLEKGLESETFAFHALDGAIGYLSAVSTDSNYLHTNDTLTTLASWTITVSSDGEATVTAEGAPRGLLRYNSNSSTGKLFSCYKSGQNPICLYKLEEAVGEEYEITLITPDPVQGTVELSTETAHENDKVTVTVSPTANYTVSGVKIQQTDGAETVEATQDPDNPNQYTFSMPAYAVTVTVTFAEKQRATLIYSENGDTTHQDTEHYTGDVVTLKTEPTTELPEGYVFVGWSKTPIDTAQDEKPEMITEVQLDSAEVTVYAVYAIQNGEGDASSIDAPASGEYILVDTLGEGYYAMSGAVSGSSVSAVNVTENISENSDGTITIDAGAVTDTMKYTVTFNSSGSTATIQNGSSNIGGSSGSASLSTSATTWNVTRDSEDHRFGFGLGSRRITYRASTYNYFRNYTTFSSSEYGAGYLYLIPTTGGATYSGYTTSVSVTPKHTVTWHIGETMMTTQVAEGDPIEYTGEDPTKDDDEINHKYYTFTGWSKTESGEVLSALPTMDKEDVNLYAVFAEHTFATVNWVTDDRTTTEYYRAGEKLVSKEAPTKTPAAPVKEYRFEGWFTEGGQKPEDVTVAEDTEYTFNARFTAAEYYTYSASASMDEEYMEVGKSATLEATLACTDGDIPEEGVSYSVTFEPNGSAEVVEDVYDTGYLLAEIQGNSAETVTVTVTFTISNGTEEKKVTAEATVTFYNAPVLAETDKTIENDIEQSYDVLKDQANVPEGTQLLSVGASEEDVTTHPKQLTAEIGTYGTATIKDNKIYFAPSASVKAGDKIKIYYRIEIYETPYYGLLVITVSNSYAATRLTDDTLVLDFALPLTFDPLANDGLGSATLLGVSANAEDANQRQTELALTSGKVQLAGNQLTFTPTDILKEPVVFYYFAEVDSDVKVGTVTLIPATNVYYEDNFSEEAFKFSPDTAWRTDGSPLTAEQKADFAGAASAVYGYDDAYAASGAGYSMKSAHVATVDTNQTYASVEFDFHGRGFDVISMTGGNTGVVIVTVTRGKETVVNQIIDTYYGFAYQEEPQPVKDAEGNPVYVYEYVGDGKGAYALGNPTTPPEGTEPPKDSGQVVYYVYVGEGNGDYNKVQKTTHWVETKDSGAYYQIPLIRVTGLDLDDYQVKVSAFYNTLFDHREAHEYQFIFDAVRIYDPCGENVTAQEAYTADGENNANLTSLHDLVFESMPKLEEGYTAVFSVPAGHTQPENQKGTSVKMPKMEDIKDDEVTYTFAGWTDQAVTDAFSLDGITVHPADTTVELTGNQTFYALYQYEQGSTPEAFKAGDSGEYVIAALEDGTYYAMSNNFPIADGKLDGTEITVTDGAVSAKDAEPYKVTLTYSDGVYRIYNGARYLAYNDDLQKKETNFVFDTDPYDWKLSQQEKHGTWRFASPITTNRAIVYRGNTTNKFGGYATSNVDGTNNTEYYNVQVLPINMGKITHYTTVVGGASAAMREPPKPETDTGIYIDGKDGASLQEYLDYGPANELELSAGQAISFGVDFMGGTPTRVLLGIKRAGPAEGSATVTVQCGEEKVELSVTSETEMYYDITTVAKAAAQSAEHPLVILNGAGSPLISLTVLKWTADASAVTANLYMTPEMALSAMRTVDRLLGNEPSTDDPTDPTEPSEPVEPTDPSNPSEPVEPSNPSEPIEPTDPSKPTEPVEPSKPTEPTEPTDPSEPVEPSNPSEPVDSPEPIEPEEPTLKAEDFDDLDAKAWYYPAVDFALQNGLMNGVGEGKFEPNGTLNRAMVVTVLYRQAGSPEPKAAAKFTDVPANAYYAKAVAWANEQGIALGATETTFEPLSPVTREQTVTFLWRYCGQPKPKNATLTGFADTADVSAYAAQAMRWAVENGVINGDHGRIRPKGEASRAEAAAIFQRTAPLLEKAETDR